MCKKVLTCDNKSDIFHTGHEMKECTGTTPDAALVRSDPAFGNQDSFIFVRLTVLREYLEKASPHFITGI